MRMPVRLPQMRNAGYPVEANTNIHTRSSSFASSTTKRFLIPALRKKNRRVIANPPTRNIAQYFFDCESLIRLRPFPFRRPYRAKLPYPS